MNNERINIQFIWKFTRTTIRRIIIKILLIKVKQAPCFLKKEVCIPAYYNVYNKMS